MDHTATYHVGWAVGARVSVDLVLSSGFLAFAEHAGFLTAVEDGQVPVDAVVGTSSGALAGALWCAGWSASEILGELTATMPLRRVGFHGAVWRGVFTMAPVIARLREVLPASFEELKRPFAVGVAVAGTREAALITSGDLCAAVAASCAVPWLFCPVAVDGRLYLDGGAVDRVAVDGWRRWRPGQSGLLHLVEKSLGPATDADLTGVTVVSSPRSGAKLWSLGDVQGRSGAARSRTASALGELGFASP